MPHHKQKRNSNIEVRAYWWTPIASFLICSAIKLICWTLRARAHFKDKQHEVSASEMQTIVALWHNRTFAPSHYHKSKLRSYRKMCVMASASRDGSLVATVAKLLGMSVVRGSSHRRGAEAFRGMLAAIKRGENICLTPDGPRGPLYRCQLGVVKLASRTGLPITPLTFSYSRFWRLRKTWDRFIIPKPFSHLNICWGPPIYVPPNLSNEELEPYCKLVEEALSCGAPDFKPFTQYPYDN